MAASHDNSIFMQDLTCETKPQLRPGNGNIQLTWSLTVLKSYNQLLIFES